MFPTPGRGKHWAGFTFTWPESPAGSTITLDQVKPDERVIIDDTETWIDLTPRGKAQWIRFHHHPIPHIRIQVNPFLKPNRVSGQEATRRGVKVTVREQEQQT